MQSSFRRWWEKHKRKLARAGHNLALLPPDFEDFIDYLDAQPISLQSKQDIARFMVKDIFKISFKESRRNEKKLRRARRFYYQYFHSSFCPRCSDCLILDIEYPSGAGRAWVG